MPRRRTLRTVAAALALAALTAGPLGACGGGPEAVSPAEPYKVTVAGDSISYGLGAALRDVVAERPNSVTKIISEGGTGMARPDRFDWPARLEQLAKERPPKVLLLSVGSNDAQDLADADGRTVVPFAAGGTAAGDRWDAEYSARLARSIDPFKDTGTTVLWVGHVRTGVAKVGDTNRRVHRLAEKVAATRPWVTVADLAELLGTGESVASDCLIRDGLHLSVPCYERAARALGPKLPPQGL